MAPKTATIEGLVRILRTIDVPAVDSERLAEEADLSARSIRNYREALEAHENVGSMKVDRATVFWYQESNNVGSEPDVAPARSGP